MADGDRMAEAGFRDRDQARQRRQDGSGRLVDVHVEPGAGVGGHNRQVFHRASGFVREPRPGASQIRSRSQRVPQQRPAGGSGQAADRRRDGGHDLEVQDAREAAPRVEQCLDRPGPGLFPTSTWTRTAVVPFVR